MGAVMGQDDHLLTAHLMRADHSLKSIQWKGDMDGIIIISSIGVRESVRKSLK